MKRRIEWQLDRIPKIVCEPQLISKSDPRYIVFPGQQIPAHYYRLKAVDDVKLLGKENILYFVIYTCIINYFRK